jgi:quercetin dioxygenase-like cupin family protein
MTLVKKLSEHVGVGQNRLFKKTLFRSDGILLGVNCLEPGQAQKAHSHADQDKFYYVVEGKGRFLLGEEWCSAGENQVIWAPAGMVHGVENSSAERLTLLVGIVPAP